MKYFLFCIFLISCKQQEATRPGKINYIPFNKVEVNDSFWGPKLERNRAITIPHNIEKCEEVGIVENFKIAGNTSNESYHGMPNWDEFLYKTIEAASYSLMTKYDVELDEKLDELIDNVASAQEEDGYLRTFITIGNRNQNSEVEGKWENLAGRLELYCAGHLFEAAIAHKKATGKDNLMQVALKLADLIDNTFGPGKNMGVPGHEEIELALVSLYEYTGEQRYLNLSKFFIDQRGNANGHKLYGEFCQDLLPFVEQKDAVGQAPRATYLYSGAADVAFHNGDSAYIKALNTLWKDVVLKKMYINGGIGSRHDNEGFGEAYDLPNKTAYTEICAAISFPMWNSRMFRLDQDGKYFDLIERTLYNNFIAGVSTEGNRYFYACPLESDGKYKFNLGWFPGGEIPYKAPKATRKEWFPCACCPPNLARYIQLIPGMVYAHNQQAIFVNLYIGSKTDIELAQTNVEVKITEDYPWKGKVTISVNPKKQNEFSLNLRIPGWAQNQPVPGDLYCYADKKNEEIIVAINGEKIEYQKIKKGYLNINRNWSPGDVVTLNLPMQVRKVLPHPSIKENHGKIALEYGPMLYCVEGIDNEGYTTEISIDKNAKIQVKEDPTLLGSTMVLSGKGFVKEKPIDFKAIPYYLWSNRGEGKMAVWLQE